MLCSCVFVHFSLHSHFSDNIRVSYQFCQAGCNIVSMSLISKKVIMTISALASPIHHYGNTKSIFVNIIPPSKNSDDAIKFLARNS